MTEPRTVAGHQLLSHMSAMLRNRLPLTDLATLVCLVEAEASAVEITGDGSGRALPSVELVLAAKAIIEAAEDPDVYVNLPGGLIDALREALSSRRRRIKIENSQTNEEAFGFSGADGGASAHPNRRVPR